MAALKKKMSKAGKFPPSSRNPSLGPRRSLRQSHFLLMSLNFLHSQIGDLLSGCVPPLLLLTRVPPEPVSGRLPLPCAYRALLGVGAPLVLAEVCRGWQGEGARGGLPAGSGDLPRWEQDLNPSSRLFLLQPALAFWSSSGLFILCHSILCLPSLPHPLLHFTVSGYQL